MRIAGLLLRGRMSAALFILAALCLALPAPSARAEGESVRPEVGKPLQAAQEAMKAKKFQEALAKVREADGVAGKTPYEAFIIERMRGSAAAGAGDNEAAAKSFEAVIASGRLPAGEQLKLIEALAGTYYRAKDFAKAQHWAQRYFKDGGTSSSMRTLLGQMQFMSGDYAASAKELSAEVAAAEAAGNAPAEDRLQLLANCYLKLNDKAGYAATMEKLVAYHPKKEYWADLLNRLQRKQGFSNRLTLDVYRLMQATGNLQATADYMEMAQLALQAGVPAEAKRVVDEGYAKSLLGAGAEADRHKRLRDLANKQTADEQKAAAETEKQALAAKDGNALVSLGAAYCAARHFDKGIPLIEKGIAKGELKRPDEAKLHLGLAHLQAGNKAKAVQILRSVRGADGSADLARLWAISAA